MTEQGHDLTVEYMRGRKSSPVFTSIDDPAGSAGATTPMVEVSAVVNAKSETTTMMRRTSVHDGRWSRVMPVGTTDELSAVHPSLFVEASHKAERAATV